MALLPLLLLVTPRLWPLPLQRLRDLPRAWQLPSTKHLQYQLQRVAALHLLVHHWLRKGLAVLLARRLVEGR